jgi:cytochrome c biogenesis protein CcmG/thiol:disulfide interchange protein DsbE
VTARRWLVPLAAVPLLILLAYGFRHDPRDIPSPLVGRPALPFQLAAFDGAPLGLDRLQGRVVLLNFWASWCYPACYEEAPVLEAAWRAYGPRGLAVVGVDVQDTEPAARRFLDQHGITFPNAPDAGGRVAIDYGVYGVPETFLIDRRGVIRDKKVGGLTESYLREKVAPLLAETPS